MKTGSLPDYFAESMNETEEYWDNKFKQEKKKAMPGFGRGQASTHNWKGVRSQSEVDMCTSRQQDKEKTMAAKKKAPLPYEIPIGIQGEIRRTADELSHEAIFVGIPAETINEALQGLIIRSKS